MHARFWDDDTLDDPAYELADVETVLTMVWPRSWPAMESPPDGLTAVQRGWQALLDRVDPDVRATIEQVMADPGPLVAALEASRRRCCTGTTGWTTWRSCPTTPWSRSTGSSPGVAPA